MSNELVKKEQTELQKQELTASERFTGMVMKEFQGNIGALNLNEYQKQLMKKYNIEPKKIRFVYPNNAKNSDLVLIEGTLNGKSGLKIMNPLFVYVKKDVYSKEVKDMFGE